MTRRQTKNITGIPRIEGVPFHDAWVSFTCIKCGAFNLLRIGQELLAPQEAYETAEWVCEGCGFLHSRETDLPFDGWPKALTTAKRVATQRFWRAFFRFIRLKHTWG